MTFYTTVRQKQTNYSDTISTYFLRTIIWNTACEREECWLADVCPDVRTLFPCWISRNTSSAFSMCSSFSPTTFTCPLWSSSTRSFNFLLSKSNTCQTQCHENYLYMYFPKKYSIVFLCLTNFIIPQSQKYFQKVYWTLILFTSNYCTVNLNCPHKQENAELTHENWNLRVQIVSDGQEWHDIIYLSLLREILFST